MSGIQQVLMSAAGAQITLQAASYDCLTTTPAAVELRSDGTVYGTFGSNTLVFAYNWVTNGNPANYEVRATLSSGTFSSGTVNSWLNLGTTRAWTRGAAVGAAQAVTATFEIRDASTLTVLASASIDLLCDRT